MTKKPTEVAAHPFDEAIRLAPVSDHVFEGQTHPGYANMVGPYGGVTAAQVINAVLIHPERLGEPIALTVNFAAALADGPLRVEARPARTNRSTQHWEIQMRQTAPGGEAVVATATAVTALRRQTLRVTEQAMPEVPAPHDVPRPTAKARVEWVKRYEMRPIEGGFPQSWSGQDEGSSRSRLWVRDNPPRNLDFASLTAMADVFFPRIWLRRAQLVPLGTVSMTVYFHASAQQLAECGEDHLLGQVQGQAFADGFFDHSGQLWSQSGHLLATTHQVVYFKE